MSSNWTPDTDDIIYQDSFDAIIASFKGILIRSGMEVTAAGTPNKTINIASGVYYIDGDKYSYAGGSLDLTTEIDTNMSATETQFALIHINTSGTVSYTAGTYVTSSPKSPSLPASVCPIARVQLTYNTVIQTADIHDSNRVYQPIFAIDQGGTGKDGITADTFWYGSATDVLSEASITTYGRSLIDDADAGTARTTLGLGTMAIQNSSAVAITGGTLAGITSFGASANLDFGNWSLTAQTLAADIATGTSPLVIASTTVVANLNVDSVDGYDFNQSLQTTDTPSFSTITSSVAIGTAPFTVTSTTKVTNLNADMVDGYTFNQSLQTTDSPTFAGVTLTGNLAIAANSITGTNVSLTNAKLEILDDISALALTNGNFIVGDGTNWVAESGSTARTSMGAYGSGDNVSFGTLSATTISGTTISGTTITGSGDMNIDSGVLFVDVSANKVGINDTTPTYTLDVTGSIHASTTLYVGSLGSITYSGTYGFQFGFHVSPSSDNVYDLGHLSRRWDDVYATNGTIQTSARKYKEKIKPLDYGLETILNIEPVSYFFKDKKSKSAHIRKLGVIADDLIEIVPELVVRQNHDKKGEVEGFRYEQLIPVLVNAIKELTAKVQQLEKDLYEEE